MSDFVAALASSLDKTVVHRGTSVHKLERLATGRWRVESLANDSTTDERSAEFDAVVLALPSNHAARLLEPVHATLAAELAAIPLASSAVVCLGVDQADIARPLDAFGCVVPAAENRPVLAISYSSLKFPGRAPAGKLLLRVFVGGALQPGLADLPDEPLGQLALEQTRAILGYSGTPHLRMIVRWPQAMPQYHVGHLARVARIERLVTELPCLQLAGNSMHGVGIPQCVRTARKAAEGLIEQLVGTSSHASPAQQEHPSP